MLGFVKYRPNSITLSSRRYPGRRPGRRPACACRVRVAGRSKAGRKPATIRSATKFELSRHVEIARTCLRPAFDPKKSRTGRELVADPHELVGRLVRNRVCDQACDLDSVIEFGPAHAAPWNRYFMLVCLCTNCNSTGC